MFSSFYIEKTQNLYGVDVLEFKNCYEVPSFNKVVFRSASKDISLVSRPSKIFQNSFFLELLLKQPSFLYSPKKQGQKVCLPASKTVLKRNRSKIFLSALLVLQHKIIKKTSIGESTHSLKFFFKDPLNFPRISGFYSLFVSLGSVVLSSDFVLSKTKTLNKRHMFFFLDILVRN